MIQFNNFFVFIYLSFAGTAAIQYPLFFSYILTALCLIIIKGRLTIPKLLFNWIDYVPVIFVAVWAYGLLIGLFRANDQNYIVANFAGMLLYVLFYGLISSKISKEAIFETVYRASLFVLWLNIVIAICWLTIGISWYNDANISLLFGEFRSGSSTGQSRLFNANQIIIFIFLAISLKRLFFSPNSKTNLNLMGINNRLIALLNFILSLLILVGVGGSKGYMFSIIVLFILFYFFSEHGTGAKRVINFFRQVFFVIIFIFSLSVLGYLNIATSIFSEDDIGNISRYEQLYYFINDFSFFGKGLGSVVEGYISSSDKPYGYELSYLNIIHKFGVFSMFLFSSYFFCVYTALKGLSSKNVNDSYFAAASLGALAYLGPSLGNPIIFNPQMVLLHCLSIYLIRPSGRSRSIKVDQKVIYSKMVN